MFFKDDDDKKKQQQELLYKMKEEERRHRLQMDEITVNVFNKISTYLDAKELEKSVPQTKQELMTLSTGGNFFDTEGYPYVYFVLGSSEPNATLTIDILGIRYNQTITTGYNAINLIDGATITADKSVTVAVVRTFKRME